MSYKEAFKLFVQGNFEKSLAMIKQLPPKDVLRGLGVKSHILLCKGLLKESLRLSSEVIQKSKEINDRIAALYGLFVRLETLRQSGEFNDVIDSAKEINDIVKLKMPSQDDQVLSQELISLLYSSQAFNAAYVGKCTHGIEMGKKALVLANKITSPIANTYALYAIGFNYRNMEEFSLGFEYTNKALTIAKQNNFKTIICMIYVTLRFLYRLKGDMANSLKFTNSALALSKEIGFKLIINYITGDIGHLSAARGDYDQAIDQFKEGYQLAQARQDLWIMTQRSYDLGHVYRLKGEVSLALNTFKESLTLSEKIGNNFFQSKAYQSLGMVYHDQGSYQHSLDMFQKSLSIMTRFFPKSLSIASTLLALVLLNIDLENITKAKYYLTQLEEVDKTEVNRPIHLNFLLAKALVLKTSPRMKNKVQAQAMFEAIANDAENPHESIIFAMLNLCELLLYEYKSEGESEILNEIKVLSQRLYTIGQEKNIFPTTIKALLLQAKLSLVEGDFKKVEELLEEAHQIAQRKGLGKLLIMVTQEQGQVKSELERWSSLFDRNASIQERIAKAALETYVRDALQIIDSGLKEILEYKYIPKKKFNLVYNDLLKESPKIQKRECKVAIAQIGLSKTGNILDEFYNEKAPGFFGLRIEKLETVRAKVKNMIEIASSKGANILLFPELTIDLNYSQLQDDVVNLAKKYGMYIIPGSYHNEKTNRNLSVVISAGGILWQQEKHIPATIHFAGKLLKEGIEVRPLPQETIICNTEYGRIAIVICRDFLDLDLRVEIKNFEPPVDMIFNPAFTPVTNDFQAAHFDARRSIYAYCFFANVAEFGNSLIYTPEKERDEKNLPPKEENLIYKNVDIFRLRSERKKWEIEQKKIKPFIQSTRS
ncbi:MAG: tetratricopeptide repeat protein [Candidatus Hodarchaeota archaeon]